MDDSTLEREIEALMAAAPSHGFTARVRERIATAPRRGVWPAGAGFAWAAFATAATALALGAVALRVDRQPAAERGLRARAIGIEAYQAPQSVHASRPRGQAPAGRRQPRGGRPPAVRMEPEIIIAPSEAAAWRRLLAGTAAGAMTLSFAGRTAAPIGTAAPEDLEFAIPPVMIEPLAPARGQGVQQ